jgi:hypothetical protein
MTGVKHVGAWLTKVPNESDPKLVAQRDFRGIVRLPVSTVPEETGAILP